MVADERLGVGLRQPASRLATSEPLQHRLAHYPTRAPRSHNEIGRRVAPTAGPCKKSPAKYELERGSSALGLGGKK
jgi:hypothetical protein